MPITDVDEHITTLWREAARDLGIGLVSPFAAISPRGESAAALAWLRDFGSPRGALVCTSDDPNDLSRRPSMGIRDRGLRSLRVPLALRPPPLHRHARTPRLGRSAGESPALARRDWASLLSTCLLSTLYSLLSTLSFLHSRSNETAGRTDAHPAVFIPPALLAGHAMVTRSVSPSRLSSPVPSPLELHRHGFAARDRRRSRPR